MKWISVKDRLPEDKKGLQILVHTSEGIDRATFGEGIMDKEAGRVGGWERCYYCGGESRVTFAKDTKFDTIKLITHWMPLPELPKE